MISEYLVSYIKTKRVSLPGDDVMMLSALCCSVLCLSLPGPIYRVVCKHLIIFSLIFPRL